MNCEITGCVGDKLKTLPEKEAGIVFTHYRTIPSSCMSFQGHRPMLFSMMDVFTISKMKEPGAQLGSSLYMDITRRYFLVFCLT